MILGLILSIGSWRHNWRRSLGALALVLAADIATGVAVAALLGVNAGWGRHGLSK